jgi:formate C-acetyltransferase
MDRYLSIKPTPRVEKLREDFFSIKPTCSIARARIETRIMKETEGESVVTRRAKVFSAVVREMPLYIYPGQLFAGCHSVRPRCREINPGSDVRALWDKRARSYSAGISYLAGISEDSFPLPLSDEERKELEEVTPYWKEQGKFGKNSHYGHNIHNYEKVLKKGFLGIKKDAEDRLSRLDLSKAEDTAKVPFLEGVIMAMDASAGIGKRFAALAREMAKKEKDAVWKADLLEIAKVCDWVPAHPARTFREALQTYFLTHILLFWEVVPSMGFSQGRMDQYLYPYYERDIREGRITKDEAQELVDCYFIGINYETEPSRSSPIAVGGVKTNGQDATNELSYMMIEATMHTQLDLPWLSVIVHSQMPDELLIKACQLSAMGTGHPQWVNNDIMVAQVLARGDMGGPVVTLEDARNASPQGCFELVIPGKDSGYLYNRMPNFAACVEFVLTNGKGWPDRERHNQEIKELTGVEINDLLRLVRKPFEGGIETGDPRQFKTFEEFKEAYRKQLAWMRQSIQIAGTNNELTIREFTPTVYESALIDDCIEKGLSREFGGAHYNFNNGGAPLGTSDAADSLTAIRKLIFEDKKITMAQLCDALEHNFKGYEDIRRICLEAPKFGNDDDYPDQQVAWVLHEWMVEFNKITNLRGGRGCPGGSVVSAYVPAGLTVGALPSGRSAWEPMCDASSPTRGMDRKGVTAVVKSMGKIDHVEILGGITFNVRLNPEVFKDGDIQKLADLVRTFIDQKIFHMQINVVSTETLKAAQKEPEKYRDLMVKVVGYNAFFTQLSKPLQDSVIARTEHSL